MNNPTLRQRYEPAILRDQFRYVDCSYGTFELESCCDGQQVYVDWEENGIRWPEGVRHWNQGRLIGFRCARCGRGLKYFKMGHDNRRCGFKGPGHCPLCKEHVK